jgi:outer membrane protein assembly factor BamB
MPRMGLAPAGRARRLTWAGLVLGAALSLGPAGAVPAGASARVPAAPATQAAGDWTRWKFDAANTGVNPHETRLGPGNVRGLRRTWFRDLCCGSGPPLVADGMVYIGAEASPGGPGVVVALDAATGVTRWTSATGSERSPSGLAMADSRVFALPDGGAGSPMAALDAATGRRLWTTELTPGDSRSFYAAPNVSGGVVFVTAGDTRMRALDAATGRLRWRAFVTRTGGATGPAAIAGGLAYMLGDDGVLLAKDVDNGVNRWKAFPGRDGGRGRLLGAPSVRGGRVFLTTEGGSVLAYRAAGCLPALTCEPLWVTQRGVSTPFESTPGVGRTTVFVGGPARLDALDAATGRRRWTGAIGELGDESVITAPVIANGVIYATSVDNRVHAFPSAGCGAGTCRPLWSGEINPDESTSTSQAPPAVSHGAVYADAHPFGLSRWAVPTAGQAAPVAGLRRALRQASPSLTLAPVRRMAPS